MGKRNYSIILFSKQIKKYFVKEILIGQFVIILTRINVENKIFIPKKNLISTNFDLSFKFERRQFQVTLYLTMKMNKSQGQFLSHGGLSSKACLHSGAISCNIKSHIKKRSKDFNFGWRKKLYTSTTDLLRSVWQYLLIV